MIGLIFVVLVGACSVACLNLSVDMGAVSRRNSHLAMSLSLSLAGKVVCVTGGSRGIGRGIALGLAEHGATVYVTGRSMDDASVTESELGGTVRSVCAEIDALGGRGIPMKVDHADDSQVADLFRDIEAQAGRLDILVNNAFQVPCNPRTGKSETEFLFRNYWEQPGWFWDQVINVGLRSHYIASCYATPLMLRTAAQFYCADTNVRDDDINDNRGSDGRSPPLPSIRPQQQKRPLIAHVSSFGGASYSFNVAYGVGKAGVDRMAKDMHIELEKHHASQVQQQRSHPAVACISLYPGIVRTERMREILGKS